MRSVNFAGLEKDHRTAALAKPESRRLNCQPYGSEPPLTQSATYLKYSDDVQSREQHRGHEPGTRGKCGGEGAHRETEGGELRFVGPNVAAHGNPALTRAEQSPNRAPGTEATILSHTVERVLPYSRELLFDVAADVERYSDFHASWTRARITRREVDRYWTEQMIALGPLRASSDLRRSVPAGTDRRDVYRGALPFVPLRWTFESHPDGGTRAKLARKLDVYSGLLERIVDPVHKGIIADTIAGFKNEAARTTGPAAGIQIEWWCPRPTVYSWIL